MTRSIPPRSRPKAAPSLRAKTQIEKTHRVQRCVFFYPLSLAALDSSPGGRAKSLFVSMQLASLFGGSGAAQAVTERAKSKTIC